MTRRHALIAAAAILVSVVAIIVGWRLGQKDRAPSEVGQPDVPQIEIPDGETLTAALFFPGPGGRLFAEERELAVQADLLALARAVLDELLAGPLAEDLFPALPPEIIEKTVQKYAEACQILTSE